MHARSIADLAGIAALALVTSASAACSRSETADAGAGGSASAASSASSALAMVTPACGKTGYVDGTGEASHALVWSPAITKEPKKCLKVKAGATVKWTSAEGFSVYPIVPGATGPSSSPITATASGDSVEAKFDVPGFYPYACSKRGDMVGTIWVVPQN